MDKFEQQSRKKRHHEGTGRNDTRPHEDATDNARNRTAIIISGRLADHETGRNTWEHANNKHQFAKGERP